MEYLKAIFLGLLQGLTEFLPVSSSGHLAIAEETLPGTVAGSLAFNVILHAGTLLSVLVYFRTDLTAMAAAVFGMARPRGYPAAAIARKAEIERRTVALLAVATVPIVIVGFGFASEVEEAFHSLAAVGCALLVTAAALWFASTRDGGTQQAAGLGWGQALLIGCFQAVAVMPGVSRSGLTLVGALLCGMERGDAARFAFLMAIPAIGGAFVHSAGDITALGSDELGPVLAGAAAAASTGFFAIGAMMRVVRRGRLRPFALYCVAAGAVALGLSRL